jgi:hypothetical protein
MAASPFNFSLFLDSYTRKARLLRALVLALPVAVATLAWFPTDFRGLNVLASGFVWYVGASVAVEMARDRGRALEPKLFKRWGGKPTTRLLRHRHAPNKSLVERQHRTLERLVGNITLPSAADEKVNPGRADELYDLCVAYLIEHTRDTKRFPLVFAENCSYGFRRNVLGLKHIGIFVTVLGVAAASAKIHLDVHSAAGVGPLPVASALICAILLAGWVFWVRPDWVMTCADAYALQLLRACEVLGQHAAPNA